MKLKAIHVSLLATLVVLIGSEVIAEDKTLPFPENHKNVESPISYSDMVKFLDSVKSTDFIDVSIEGSSVENRSLHLVHLCRGEKANPWKVFLFAQQHGNEPAGKDALIYLIKYISEQPSQLPKDVDLYIMPMVNPDGAESGRRRNGNDFDLNRDHQLLAQPETRTLHKIFRRIMPHVAVDCHEFTRDSRDYAKRGWLEWPLIMMDCANNPIFHPEIYKTGVRWCKQISPYMNSRNHNYIRYYLGGLPPEDELRHSTLEVDDARNGLGTYGGLSFIIESGIKRSAENPDADLNERIDAYLDIFYQFIRNKTNRKRDMEVIEKSRSSKMSDFIPVNYFWANNGQKVSNIKVIDKENGNTIKIPTANFMQDITVKRSVSTPSGYIIDKKHATRFKKLLEINAISYITLEKAYNYYTERCQLIRFEDYWDDVYSRYEDRQIVERKKPENIEFEEGSIFVSLDQLFSKRAALLLEPSMLYGLYQYPEFRNLIGEDKVTPVYRVISTQKK